MRILELTLLAADVGAMRAFYGERLGLVIAEQTPTSITFLAGETVLTFEASGPGIRPFYHFAFNVVPTRFGTALAWIRERARVLGDGERVVHFPTWNADSVYFEDPAGSIVELIARHALDRRERHAASVQHPFSSDAFLGVSEIGLPLDHVEPVTRFIGGALGAGVWDRSSSGFTALGDEHGLLILVPLQRAWYPTDRPAGVFPVVMTVEGSRERRVTIPPWPYLVVTRPRTRTGLR